ncbi:peptidase C39 [Prochlorococcus marinus XMU1403]|uniref:ABC transporter transmembrane domain-containing protein n=1 Tax=Prochlorococcus marinus TaxID=1219 RepID=UPI000D9888E1|nr:ABC transporter transmembrane domain-containing protein [Prochlorococcus marinus]MBW3050283.1 peptidase C39 [Prochlorococcus marinus str. MU1403]PYE00470.1 peptidase C39 [Prochlorococcus marinus XMU1403]
MNFNLRSIIAFQNISQEGIDNIRKNLEIYKYPIGYPILNDNFIPNKVLIIISGEARLIHKDETGIKTIYKLKTNDMIGVSSLLRGKGSEPISASSELKVLAINDAVIIQLYKEDKNFREWFNSNIQRSEIYQLSNQLILNSSQTQSNIKECFDLLLNNTFLESIYENKEIKLKENYKYFISSNNIIDKSIGDELYENILIKTSDSLPGRILKIHDEVYHQIFEVTNKNIDSNLSNEEDQNVKYGPDMLEVSKEKVGQYNNNDKKFKIINANGEVREALACIQMLSIELKLPYRSDSIEKILNDAIKRGKKPTLQLLGGITTMIGLHSSIFKINKNLINRLPKNTIISFRDSFGIIKDSSKDLVEVVSPKDGIVSLTLKDIEKEYTQNSIEVLISERTEQTPDTKFGLKWLFPSLNRYRNVLFQVLLASFVVQLFGLANPLMIQIIIDKVISQRSLDTLQILGVALVVVTILGGIISSLRTFLFNETTNRIDTRLGSEVIDHLLRLPLNYFDRRPVGELGSRIAELEKIRNFLTGQALTTILDAVFSIIYIIVMVFYSWLLTIIALGVVPIQILITIIGTPLIRKQIREVAVENAKTQSHLVEVLTGIQTVKAQNVERVSRWKWQELYSQYISRSFQKTITGTALGETSQVFQQLSQLLVLWVGASLVLKGQLTLGQLIAFRIISGYVTQPLLRLSTIWQNIQELRVSFERLSDIVDTPQETTESDKAKIPLPSIKGSVNFENISFGFGNGNFVLNQVDLKVEPGTFVGIVGESGSGKSTLVKLLPRLYKPNKGRITIDNYDINKVELYSLRRQIGIVPQEPLLFAGTVNDNIALTDPESASDDIVKVSKIADAHDFIMELQDGYSTNVGERGAGLSGGQKQRIAIARTLLSNPKLLILDEATSALDYATERRVCEGLRESCRNSTVFFITHRLSTVKNADLIVMLDQGSIVEKGTHQELMELKGRYFALYRQQDSV